MNYILISGLIIILIIVIIIFVYRNNIERFSDNIYMSQEETIKFIDADEDKYIENLSKYDLYARKCENMYQYKKKVMAACLNFTEKQKNKLDKCTVIARNYYDNNKTWKFALIDDDYEEGFPHTRNDIIFLSPKIINYEEDELIKILIHESIHILQRYDKDTLNIYLMKKKYTVSRKRETEPLIRANPDLDEFIYKDENGDEMINKYKSETPQGINDIIPSKNEHPFEVMAYEISEDYIKYKLSKYKYI
jgi:hypothetical protein